MSCTEVLDELPEADVWCYGNAGEYSICHWTTSLSSRKVMLNPRLFICMAILAYDRKLHDLAAKRTNKLIRKTNLSHTRRL